MSFQNLLVLLEDVATEPDSGQILCYPDDGSTERQSWPYSHLLIEARRVSCAVRSRAGMAPGSNVLLYFTSHWDNIVWFWGVLLAGCIPVISTALPSSDSLRKAHLKHLARTLMSPFCFTRANLIHELDGQNVIDPVPIDSLDLKGEPDASLIQDLVKGVGLAETAAILLTSGSTGRCKAVCLSHGQILAAAAGKLSVLPPAGKSFLNWVGLDHVAALVEVHIQAMLARKDQIHVPASSLLSNPTVFLDLIDRHRVSRTFAPNFFLAKLRTALRHAETKGEKVDDLGRWDLSCLTCINSGGEANLTRICDEVSGLLVRYGTPKNVIIPGFGMTETCAGAIFNVTCPQYDREHQLEYASVGRCMSGIAMRITNDRLYPNAPVPTGEIGSLELTGSVVFKQYLNNHKATMDSFTSDGWFRTGDRGFLDPNGYLHLTGRTKETLIVNGIKYDPHMIETAVEEANIPGVKPSFNCCFSYLAPGAQTEDIYLVYLPTYATEDLPARVRATDAISKVIMMATGARPQVIPLDESHLQKSSLGKLPRAQIKASYERGEYSAYESFNRERIQFFRKSMHTPPRNDYEKELLATFIDSLALSDEDEFHVQTPILDLGITSVELIKLKKDLEASLGLQQEIPIITLITNQTVRDLGIALQRLQGSSPHVYNPVVILQSEGSKAPLWLVHPGVGEVLVFLNLAKFIKDRPVYALRARGFNEGEHPFTNIPEVVATYHRVIKEKQPNGPYALAGYSYGSMLAFEISKVLEANQDQVAFTGSFNLPPHIKTRMQQLDFKECLLHLAYFLDLMTEQRARELATQLHKSSREEALQVVMQNASIDRLAELALSERNLDAWASLAFGLQSMAVDYDPSGSILGLDCFYCEPLAVVASSKQQWLEDHLRKWSDFTRSEVRFHPVSGSHYTMLSSEHVFAFQKILRQALERRRI
ncbi:hypothetical protein FE257_001130 [Aspergillus nanangensis]|uniref:Carrier domain-containing protein n=1 Tax=Aspergillus nanangensis TaxID=2582783 RepID=A0AAD4CVU2_ASPNN|nr:hypothetical protein FE257_001130 [Aspergillus nanangensis]